MSVESTSSEGGWPGGWLISAVAGVLAAVLARWLGDVGMAAALLVGVAVFLVFGVLLGMFWAPVPSGAGGDHGHGHDDHGHGDQGHGHDDHGHGHDPAPVAGPVAVAAPVVVVAPVAPAPVAPAPVAPAPVAPVAEPAPTVSSEAAATVEAGKQMQNEGDEASVPAPTAEVEAVAPAAAAAATALEGGTKPAALSGPRGGEADKLQTIEGIGPVLEKLCHELGIFHFDQIAGWAEAEIAWMDGNLKGFKGRVSRDKWVRQAKLIGEVGIPEFLRRAKTNDY